MRCYSIDRQLLNLARRGSYSLFENSMAPCRLNLAMYTGSFGWSSLLDSRKAQQRSTSKVERVCHQCIMKQSPSLVAGFRKRNLESRLHVVVAAENTCHGDGLHCRCFEGLCIVPQYQNTPFASLSDLIHSLLLQFQEKC